ncbi:MAG: MOSC domain-containing protein [Bacteroidia bacterium]|nr:MOSC domain-containing protein [Bacteroidia bacterium]
MYLREIWVYPVKSLGGISLSHAAVTLRGLQHDRRWLITDPDGMFMTQRRTPRMTLLQPEILPDRLLISHRHHDIPPLEVPFVPEDNTPVEVKIWNDTVTASRVGAWADAWLTEQLQTPCQLVYMSDECLRPVDPRYAIGADHVSFADGYPFLILGQAALDQLNARMDAPVPINRFRPNFVFSGGEPHAEDTWREFRIGGHPFVGVKPCVRCEVPAIDQETGVSGKEPLRTLATYRNIDHKIFFGMNLLTPMPGTVAVGDKIEIG